MKLISTVHSGSSGGQARFTEPHATDTKPLLRTVRRISQSDIMALLNGEVLAIRMRGFTTLEGAETFARRLESAGRFSGYGKDDGSSEVLRMGRSLYETLGDAERLELYFHEAERFMGDMRGIAYPYPQPTDLVRVMLDEAWPMGATIGSFYGRRAYCGSVRAFEPFREARPHTDRTDWDIADAVEAQALRGQISANVYLAVPEFGGELELWHLEPNREQYNDLRTPGDYGLDRAKIGSPDLVVKPDAGDLILFSARRVHAVRAGEGVTRLAQSSFIGYSGDNCPLTLFS